MRSTPTDSSILNSVRGAFVHPMHGDCLPIDGKKDQSLRLFPGRYSTGNLLPKALEEDVDLWLNSRVTGIERSQNEQKVSIVKRGEKQVLKAKVVIGAGRCSQPGCKMVRTWKMSARLLPGIQAEVPYRSDGHRFCGVVRWFTGSGIFRMDRSWSMKVYPASAWQLTRNMECRRIRFLRICWTKNQHVVFKIWRRKA